VDNSTNDIKRLENQYGKSVLTQKALRNPKNIPLYINDTKTVNRKIYWPFIAMCTILCLVGFQGFKSDRPQELLFIIPLPLYLLIFCFLSLLKNYKIIKVLERVHRQLRE